MPDPGTIQSWFIAIGAFLGPIVGGTAAAISFTNRRRAGHISEAVRAVKQTVETVERKMDGPLEALIAAIKAEAAAKIATAEAQTIRRIAQAYAAGQDTPHVADPAIVQAIAVEALRFAAAKEADPSDTSP